jgi:hypothetical protein
MQQEPQRLAADSKDAQKAVKSFCEYVVWLKAVHTIYLELFEDEGAEHLLQKTAPSFFVDINKMLVDYFLLSVARILDPPRMGRFENFTVDNFLETIDWPEYARGGLSDLNKTLQAFKAHIAPARNKLIAHLDKKAFIDDHVLGEFPEGQDREVIKALEDMCNVMHKASFGEIFGSISVGVGGDVLDLKKTLQRGLAFERLLREAKGDEKLRLYLMLKPDPGGSA